MMKEICAQCLQPHVDPATGKTTYVFSCFNQDQPLDVVDFPALRERLKQNSLQEKLTAQWIDRSLIIDRPPGPPTEPPPTVLPPPQTGLGARSKSLG